MPHSRSLLLSDDSDTHKCNSFPRAPLLVLRNVSAFSSFVVSVQNARRVHSSSRTPDTRVRLGPNEMCVVATLEPMEFEGGALFTALYIQFLDSVNTGDAVEVPFAVVADPMCAGRSLELLYCGSEPRSAVSILYESTADLRGLSPFRHVVKYAITSCLLSKCVRGRHMSARYLRWKASGESWSDVNDDALSSSSSTSPVASDTSPNASEETSEETASIEKAI